MECIVQQLSMTVLDDQRRRDGQWREGTESAWNDQEPGSIFDATPRIVAAYEAQAHGEQIIGPQRIVWPGLTRRSSSRARQHICEITIILKPKEITERLLS